MKQTLLIYCFLGICLLSSCSSCGDKSGGINGETTFQEGLYQTPEERLQAEINLMIDEQIEVSNAIHSNRVLTMIAGFELGMTRSEVKKHFLNMKQKKHLIRIRKRSKGSKKVYEYVYPLPLESGPANTQFNFEHQQGGGVYKLICEPQKPRSQSKVKFLTEVHQLLTKWYGPHNFQLPKQHGCERYVWIAGNRHLDLYATAKDVKFAYTDLKIEIPPNIEGGGTERPVSENLLQ